MKALKTLVLFSSFVAGSCFAGDIATEVRTGSNSPAADGGYFELGLSLDYIDRARLEEDPDDQDGVDVSIFAAGEYRYRNFFIEASQGSFDGVNLGYTLFQNERWSVDLLAATVFGSLDDENDDADDPTLSEGERDKALLERDSIYIGSGLRATAYLDRYILQARVVHDVYEGNGLIATLRLGRSWQHKNWNFHAVAGLEYGSADAAEYFFGVTDAEATARFAAYTPDHALSFTGEVGVTYPISEHWVFRSAFRYSYLDDEVSDSPLMDSDSEFVFSNSISYVF